MKRTFREHGARQERWLSRNWAPLAMAVIGFTIADTVYGTMIETDKTAPVIETGIGLVHEAGAEALDFLDAVSSGP